MTLDAAACYRALLSRDPRFDGLWFVAVRTTGVYCRPICRVRQPRPENCEFFASAVLAERHGYRPCLRCRPELAPGRSSFENGGRVAAAVAAQIAAGALAERSLVELAREQGLSDRQLRRVVQRELGVSPVELVQTHRLLLAKRLLTETTLPLAEVAFAAGFASVRRFNALLRARYGLAPTAVRQAARRSGSATVVGEVITLRLAYRPPIAWAALLRYLTARALRGIESVVGEEYRRAVVLGEHHGWVQVTPAPGEDALRVTLSLSLLPALQSLLARLRWLFDLDAEPQHVAEQLRRDPLLRPAVERVPGLRVPGAFSGFELALRAVLGRRSACAPRRPSPRASSPPSVSRA